MDTVTVNLSESVGPDRLSAQDAAFVYAETADAPMHVGMLGVFEDRGATLASVRAHIASRIHQFPRLRQRLAFVPMSKAHPVWVDDEFFDIRNHVDTEPLMNGADDGRARKLMARVMSAPLRRSRPLWEMWLFKMSDDRLGLIVKIHHCLLDGVSAVRLATVLFDARREAPEAEAPSWFPAVSPTPERLLADAKAESTSRWQAARETLNGLALRASERQPVFARASEVATSVAQFAFAALKTKRRARVAPRVGGHRLFETASVELADVKQVKSHYATKLNDVVLSTVAAGIGTLLRGRGRATGDANIKAMVPVSTRGSEGSPSYGNKVSMMAVDLPVDEQPIDELLCKISRRMTEHKQSGQADGADFWIKLAEHIPASFVSLASRAATFQRLVDVVVTNVPGPQFPLYLLGGELVEVYPFVPLFGGTPLGIALVSYNGKLFYGLSGDRDSTPDLSTLSRAVADSFDALRATLNTNKGDTDVAIDNGCGIPSTHGASQTQDGRPRL